LKALRTVIGLVAALVVVGAFVGGGTAIQITGLGTAAAVVVVRVVLVREERKVWLACAVALSFWTGQLYYIVMPDAAVTFPAIPDYMALVFYIASLVAIVFFVKSRLDGRRHSLWLDGVIGGLATAAVVSLLVFRVAISGSGVDSQIVDGQLGYAISDLFIVGFLGAVALLGRWRLGAGGSAIVGAFVALAVGDALYVTAVADGRSASAFVSALWALGALTFAGAATSPRRVATPGSPAGLMPVVLLGLSAMSALFLLLAYRFGLEGDTPALSALAGAVLAVTVVRFCVSLLENSRMLASSRHDALTDSLTGLANRRSLMDDLAQMIGRATAREPLMLTLFDLDGFKLYNDAFGHPAGDQLLARLGRKLEAAGAGHGTTYRLGGDEFCALTRGGGAEALRVIRSARESLAEDGDNFSITACSGSVAVPSETRDAEEALIMADERMYRAKGRHGSSLARRQSSDVLLEALHERQPEMEEHGRGVTALVVAVARRGGVSGEQLDEVERAAGLHDIGKIALPKTILDKPGPLNEQEWEFMHRHPLVGERILAVAPALRPIAKLVRSSHERWDGSGYPDRLSGDEIPVGSRIICACDAFDAMTEDRPYRASMTSSQAVAELRNCSGTQFDPWVVKLLCEVLDSGTVRLPLARTPAACAP
jgi:two-component system, cell cycle response regulator